MSEQTKAQCHNKNHQPPTHFIGIGGAGMSAIAQVLHRAGCEVQGSDRGESPTVGMLKNQGIPVFIGHEAGNIGQMERVVYTRAVSGDNPELVAARGRGLPVIERAEMLGQLYDLFEHRVSVAGVHGKTSTSALLGTILIECGADPTVLVGGDVPDLHGHARLGKSSLIVAEACEAYGSFLHLKSSFALIMNIDAEHLDHYKTFEGLKEGFAQFLGNMDEDGIVVACADDDHLMSLRDRFSGSWVTYGTRRADFQMTEPKPTEGGQIFSLRGPGIQWDNIFLPLSGRHYALNASGAVAAAVMLGYRDMNKICTALRQFRGVGRRMEVKGRVAGITVVDDYAHHPTEIRATLQAALEQFDGRLTVVFQPHLYSRTAEHLTGFAEALYPAERLVITNVFPARETPDKGVQSDALHDAICKLGHTDTHYVPELDDVANWLEKRLKSGDVVMTIGAGNVVEAGEALLRLLRTHPGRRL